jgi:acetoin utilization deacetylase AcuC-like enzyme
VIARADLYYTDHYELPLPAGHRFPKEKYGLLREVLQRDSRFRFHPAPLATAEEVKLAHEPAYVDAFLDGRLDQAHMRRIGFPWSPPLVERTLASAGSTLAAARRAMEAGFAATLAGGTHHAFRAEGSGYCVFNDIAVAIESLRRTHGIRRAAVIDLDVHQGDGTASLFERDPEVLTISLHGCNNFPFRKRQSNIDIEFDDGTRDEDYLAALEGVLPRIAGFGAEVLFYQAGVDAHEADKLGRLALSFAGLAARDRMVFETARIAACPFVITLGGGYAEPISITVEAHANTFLSAADWWVGESR